MQNNKKFTVAVASAGYEGLSLTTLFSQRHQLTTADIIPEKAILIHNCPPPFKNQSDLIIVAKHITEKLNNIITKNYTRDLFSQY